MLFFKKNKQAAIILAVIAIGLILAILILNTEQHQDTHQELNHTEESMPSKASTRPQHGEQEHDHEKDHLLGKESAPHDEHANGGISQEILKGPHGGKLFTQDEYSLEVTIFEQNVPPELRIYTYQNGKALNPETSTVTVQLKRLGKNPQILQLLKENDYLKSDVVVEEPHSFSVSIAATHNKKTYQFSYDQFEARVQLNDKQLLDNNIEVLTVGPASIKSVLTLQGEIKHNADKSVQAVSRVSGFVESVSVSVGDKVRKGDVLARISSQEIADMRSDLLAAQKRMYFAELTYEREKQLWEEKISAKQDYLKAENDLHQEKINTQQLWQRLDVIGASANSQNLAHYEIRSPIDGIVTNKKISEGQVVSEREILYEISDLSTVWVEMMIYAKDINIVKVGQKVSINATSFAADATGVIAYVSPLLGSQSRTAMARVVIDNKNRTWLPGLPVDINLTTDEVIVPLAVSLEGIQALRDWTVVFVRYGEYFEARPLVLGRRDNSYVEVLEGIQAGEKYAAGNSFLIKADIGKAGATHDH